MEQVDKKVSVRDSNIELLRILAILGVIVLHYNNANMGGGLKYVSAGSISYYSLHLLQAVFICGVNLFVLISGYYMCTSQKRGLVKPLELVIQVSLFRVLISCVGWIEHSSFSANSFVVALLPVNYFVILYIALYFVSPYINVVLSSLSMKSLKHLVIICFSLFSVWPTFVDALQYITSREYMGLSTIGMYGSQYGYTIVNFVLMYIIGGYIRMIETRASANCDIKMLNLRIGLYIIVVMIWLWSLFDNRTAWGYCNPLVILESVIIFLLFKRINIKSRIINSLSKATFTTFLVHTFFFRWLHIAEFVNKNVFVMLVHIFVSCIFIYIICYFIWLLYNVITTPIYNFLFKKVKPYTVDLED